MAASYSHKFGQIIGDLLEVAIEPFLQDFADQHGLFLDVKGVRTLREKRQKVSWFDEEGNKHDLDFVLEKGGSQTTQGSPVAFIEAAWRRYTKHSRNKAQEIQGAILPLAARYHSSHSFKGVILVGDFTADALTQLRSSGFTVLYFPYQTVLTAFRVFGIEAGFDEQTAEADFAEKVARFYALADPADVARKLMELNLAEANAFRAALQLSVSRQIEQIHILLLHGNSTALSTVSDAIAFVTSYSEMAASYAFVRYEIIVRYNTGTEINGKCQSKAEALDFLAKFA